MAERSNTPDRIILEGMQFYGFHGVNAEERSLGQSYVVDLAVEMDLGVPGKSDHLEDMLRGADGKPTTVYRGKRGQPDERQFSSG